MKFCTKCGNEMLDEAIICTKCGCMVENSPKKEEKIKEKNENFESMYGIISLVFGILSLISGIFLMVASTDDFSFMFSLPKFVDTPITGFIAIITGIVGVNKSSKRTLSVLGLIFGSINMLFHIAFTAIIFSW